MPKNYSSMTIPALKSECSIRGLPQGGRKAQLVARLEEYDRNNNDDGNDDAMSDVGGGDDEPAQQSNMPQGLALQFVYFYNRL